MASSEAMAYGGGRRAMRMGGGHDGAGERGSNRIYEVKNEISDF